jgi:RNA polymerase sigma factor (sigma-70 family)
MSSINEHELFTESTFKKFYIENFSALRMYVFAKSCDKDLSEDIAQESFTRLWNNKGKVPGIKARSFLFTVAGNLFLDHVRHQKVKNNFCNGFEIKNDIHDPQYIIEMDEFKSKIEATLNAMPDGAREVFLLNRMEKMTYAQIADSLGLSVKAIEKRMQKALEIMATLKLN